MKKSIVVLLVLACNMCLSQYVSIINKKFVVNGKADCPIYFNGANTPWELWNDFGNASFSNTKWKQNMVDLKVKGINASRIWISCNGDGQPNIATDGTASAPTATFWKNCDSLFKYAQQNGVYIMATMMSFDHTKPSNNKGTNWQNMMNTQAKTQTFIDNYLVPFVNRYKSNPYLWSIDLCNEIEWIAENGNLSGTDKNWGASYSILQRFVAQCAAALHTSTVARTDGSKVLVTMGSAGMKWNGTKMRNGINGTGWVANSDGNKWSDASLQAQFSNSNAYLDFYSPHYYGWLNEYYHNMFEKSPTDYGISEKACMVGEMPSRDPMVTPAMSQNTSYNNLKNLGWLGHMPWTSNITTNLSSDVGSLADFGAATLAFKNANSLLVVPTCANIPLCEKPNLGSDKSLCGISGGITLTTALKSSTNKSFKWYKNNTQVTGTTSTLNVTTAGTYIVSVDSASGTCTQSDTVVVSANIATPNINGTHICSPASTSLSYANASAGLTYSWYSDQVSPYSLSEMVLMSEQKTATFSNISTSGLYKLEVSASGCTTVSDTAFISSSLPKPMDACRNNAGSLLLSITNASGNNYGWYAATKGGTALASGVSFVTPSISTSTTYYVQNESSVNTIVGPTASLVGTNTDWGVSATSTLQMQFSVLADFEIKSFKIPMNVYSTGAVTVTVEVLDNTGTAFSIPKKFTSNATTVTTSGNNQVVTFSFTGFNVLASWGSNLRMRVTAVSGSVSPLWTNATSSVPYPYIVDKVMSITGSTGASGNQYIYFYEWNISTGSTCDRLPVKAVIDANCTVTDDADELQKETINVYPNPNKGVFRVELQKTASYISVVDVYGHEVFKHSDFIVGDVNLVNSQSGIYFLKVMNDKGISKTIKLVIE